jgi:hypothetical protein
MAEVQKHSRRSDVTEPVIANDWRAIDMMLRTQEVSDVVISYIMNSPTLTERLRRRQAREEGQEKVWLKNLAAFRYTAALRANRQLAVVLRSQGLNNAFTQRYFGK